MAYQPKVVATATARLSKIRTIPRGFLLGPVPMGVCTGFLRPPFAMNTRLFCLCADYNQPVFLKRQYRTLQAPTITATVMGYP